MLHVHDEIVTDVPTEWEGALAEMTGIMLDAPAWVKGLPIAAKGWSGERYRKD